MTSERTETRLASSLPSSGSRFAAPDLVLRVMVLGSVIVATITAIPFGPVWYSGSGGVGSYATLALVVAIAAGLPWIEARYASRVDREPREWPWHSPRFGVRIAWMAGILLVSTGGYFLLSSDALHGDGIGLPYYVKKGFWFHKRAPLSFTAYQLHFRLLGDATAAIQFNSALAGGVGVLTALAWGSLLAPGRRWLQLAIAVFLLTIGSVVLFFGHIEHYALPSALSMLFLYLGSKSLIKDESILPAAFVVTLSTAVHLSMTTMIPALAFLILVRALRSGSFRRGLVRTVLAVLAVAIPALIVWYAMQEVGYLRKGEAGFGGGDRRMFVPLETLRGKSQYLFLRPDHLLAIVNQQLLTAPVALWSCVLLIGSLVCRRVARGRALLPDEPAWFDKSVVVFVWLGAFSFFGLTVIWNPDLGPMRDWSLFAPGAFFLSMLLTLLMVVRWREQPGRVFACLLLFCAVNVHRTLPWLLQNLS